MKQIFSEDKVYFILIFLLTAIFYLPLFIYPDLLLKRGNDLSEFFWPIIYFVKTQIIDYGNFPLWNNLFLSGMPLLPDPQSPLFYLPNVIFLFFPIDSAFIIYIFIHAFFGGLGVFFCARYGFNLSTKVAFFAAAFFISSPKLAGYLEAGHLGLITSFNWLPYLLLFLIKTYQAPNFRWTSLLSVSLSQVFFTHIITFLISIATCLIFFIVNIRIAKEFKKTLIYLFLALIFTLGFISITLLPQLEWSSETTRFLLLKKPDVYPKWQSFEEFFTSSIFPWGNIAEILNIDGEKWLVIGSLTLGLAMIEFIFVRIRVKILITLFSLLVIIISLNNISPISNLLISQDFYKLMRVSTRVWFIEVFIIIFLAAYGFERLYAKLPKHLYLVIYCLFFLILLENFTLSWSRIILKPTNISDFVPNQVYDFLQKDNERFRVFCLSRCLSQKVASLENIELVEGYNTLAQYNYYQQSWQFTNSFWDYYTLSIPPISVYAFKNIQPDINALADYNVKYIISSHKIEDGNLKFREKFGKYFLYENRLYKTRAYFPKSDKSFFQEAKISHYSPNFIRVDTTSNNSKNLILAEVYNKQWRAFINGKEKVNIQETPNRLRLVDITPKTKFVDFIYQPKSFYFGIFISLSTALVIIFLNIKAWKR